MIRMATGRRGVPLQIIRSSWSTYLPRQPHEQQHCRRWYTINARVQTTESDNGNQANARRLRTCRLYRILQRQVNALQKAVGHHDDQTPILLQPPLNWQRMGASRKFSNVHATDDSQENAINEMSATRLIWQLFHHWERQHVQELKEEDEEENGDHHDYENENEHESEHTLLLDQQLRQLESWAAQDNYYNGNLEYYDTTLWTTPRVLRRAIRQAFRQEHGEHLDSNLLTHWSIRAYRYLLQQVELNAGMTTSTLTVATSSIAKPNASPAEQVQIDGNYPPLPSEPDTFADNQSLPLIRITALSRCVGRSYPSSKNNKSGPSDDGVDAPYRFVYRIRMEHLPRPSTTDAVHEENTDHEENVAIQLLGRSWTIASLPTASKSRMDQAKMDAVVENDNPPQQVHAPLTGAVGKHPVLKPSQAFEYMSGCDLATSTGKMQGTFYFVTVPMDTPSATVGQATDVMDVLKNQHNTKNEEKDGGDDSTTKDEKDGTFPNQTYRQFQVPVRPFPLRQDPSE
uniref:ApaG domain-containing protein n=2 Tax=Entomoneis paludosa TaxID=265537 RepID=A0A7S2YSQ4_9STRA